MKAVLEDCIINHASLISISECLKTNPQLASLLTTEGASFLHLAAKQRSAQEVITYLWDSYPDAACIQDSNGKTPLHYACEAFPPIPALREACAGRDFLLIVKALCNSSNVNLEDNSEMCALEYAIMASAPAPVIKLLHQTSNREPKRLLSRFKLSYAPGLVSAPAPVIKSLRERIVSLFKERKNAMAA